MAKTRILVLSVFVACACHAWGQSAYGPGGLFMTPSAYGSAEGSVELGAMGGQQGMWAKSVPHEHFLLSSNIGYGVSDRFQIGVTNIVMRDVTHPPSWGAFGKYVLSVEKGNHPAIAISGVWIPINHWRTESVALSVSKTVTFSDQVVGHVHAGAMHATWLNGIGTKRHPYAPPEVGEDTRSTLQKTLYEPNRPLVKQAPFAGIDLGFGSYVKVTAEARYRTIADHPEAIPGMVGIIFTPHRFVRVGFAFGSDGLNDENELKIGVGYNIATVE